VWRQQDARADASVDGRLRRRAKLDRHRTLSFRSFVRLVAPNDRYSNVVLFCLLFESFGSMINAKTRTQYDKCGVCGGSNACIDCKNVVFGYVMTVASLVDGRISSFGGFFFFFFFFFVENRTSKLDPCGLAKLFNVLSSFRFCVIFFFFFFFLLLFLSEGCATATARAVSVARCVTIRLNDKQNSSHITIASGLARFLQSRYVWCLSGQKPHTRARGQLIDLSRLTFVCLFVVWRNFAQGHNECIGCDGSMNTNLKSAVSTIAIRDAVFFC
jgi:hypothetical protein